MTYPDLLTPKSLAMPRDCVNNFWYVRHDSDTVMVFLHGIFSESRTCWLSGHQSPEQRVFWPDLIRADERLGAPAIYLAGYYTAIDSGDFSISQCAREVLEALQRPEADGACPVLDWDTIVFVCHSTGGIVARYMLERNKELFRDKRVGLALIASPSLGAIWANVSGLAARYYNQRLGLQLRWNGEALEDIHGRFRELVDRRADLMPGLFGMEACENKMIFRNSAPSWIRWLLPNRLKVVTTLSAGQYFGEVKILRDTDHFSTVKPDGFHHPSHEFLVTFMMRFRELLTTAPNLRKATGRTNKKSVADIVENTQSDAKLPSLPICFELRSREIFDYEHRVQMHRVNEELVRFAGSDWIRIVGCEGQPHRIRIQASTDVFGRLHSSFLSGELDRLLGVRWASISVIDAERTDVDAPRQTPLTFCGVYEEDLDGRSVVCHLGNIAGCEAEYAEAVGFVGEPTRNPAECRVYVTKMKLPHWKREGLYAHSNFINPGCGYETKISTEAKVSLFTLLGNLLFINVPSSEELELARRLHATDIQYFVNERTLRKGDPAFYCGAMNVQFVEVEKGAHSTRR